MWGSPGVWRAAPSSSDYPIEDRLSWQAALLLVCLGVAATALHAMLRLRLDLPGSYGLATMALLMAGRGSSRYRWATSLAGLGAAGTALLPFWQGGEALGWFTALLPALVLDLLYQAGGRRRGSLWWLALAGGLAHMTIPIARGALSLTIGVGFNSFRFGMLFPVATHFAFGLLGALIGLGALRLLARR